MPIHVCMYVCIYIYMYVLKNKATHEHMYGVAIVICVNITMSCLYPIVPYMCSMYPLSVDNKKNGSECVWGRTPAIILTIFFCILYS